MFLRHRLGPWNVKYNQIQGAIPTKDPANRLLDIGADLPVHLATSVHLNKKKNDRLATALRSVPIALIPGVIPEWFHVKPKIRQKKRTSTSVAVARHIAQRPGPSIALR